MLQLLLLLAVSVQGLRTKLQVKLQAEPDIECQQWLSSSAGEQFVTCETGNPGTPEPTPTFNNCSLTEGDFNAYCNDDCYDVLTKGYNFFIETGTCLPVYEDKYKPCTNNTECPVLADGSNQTCYQGFCYRSCTNSSQCNSCLSETCEDLGDSRGCRSSVFSHTNSTMNATKTIQNAFRGMVYALEARCSRNQIGNYCGLMNLAGLTTNQTCQSLEAQWGCCANTILPSMRWCEWNNFTNASNSIFLTCNFNQPPCGGLPLAQDFCTYSASSNNSSTSSSSSSSSSSGMTGVNGGGSSSTTGKDYNWLISSNTGAAIGHPAGNSASGQAATSWAMIIALSLGVAHIIS